MHKLYKIAVLLLLYLGWSQVAIAVINKSYQANPNGLNIEIANTGINRLQIEGDRIMKVISSEGECNIQHDMEHGYILISSNISAGENLVITLISEKGLVQDLEMEVKESKVKRNILLKTEQDHKNSRKNESKETEILNAIKNIVFMRVEDFSFRRLDDDEVLQIKLPIDRAVEYSNREVVIQQLSCDFLDQFSLEEIQSQFATAAAISVFQNNIYVAYRI